MIQNKISNDDIHSTQINNDLTDNIVSTWELPKFDVLEFKPKNTSYCFIAVTWNERERIKNQLRCMKRNAHLADIIIADGDSDDGSTDHKFLKEQGVRTLLVTKEIGLCRTTRMALAYSLMQGYEGVITVDGNGKDGIEALPDFITALDDGYDFIQGSRFMKGGKHENAPINRYLGVRCIFSPILSLASGYHFSDPTNAFRAMSKRYLLDRRVLPFRKEFVRFNLQLYLDYRAAKLGYKVKEIQVTRVYPNDGSVPTKIHGISVLINVLEMLKVAFGTYNPK